MHEQRKFTFVFNAKLLSKILIVFYLKLIQLLEYLIEEHIFYVLTDEVLNPLLMATATTEPFVNGDCNI